MRPLNGRPGCAAGASRDFGSRCGAQNLQSPIAGHRLRYRKRFPDRSNLMECVSSKQRGKPSQQRIIGVNYHSPRVHASTRSESRTRPTTTRLGSETGAYVSTDEALKLLDFV